MENEKYKKLVTNLRELKDLKADKTAEMKTLNEEIDKLTYQLIGEMETDGLDKISITGVGTAYVKAANYPSVEDIQSFASWCVANDRTDMLHKRVSNAACNEYYEATNELPDGVKLYTKTTMGFRQA